MREVWKRLKLKQRHGIERRTRRVLGSEDRGRGSTDKDKDTERENVKVCIREVEVVVWLSGGVGDEDGDGDGDGGREVLATIAIARRLVIVANGT